MSVVRASRALSTRCLLSFFSSSWLRAGFAQGVRNGDGRDNPVGADRHGYRCDCAHVDDRNAGPFDLFNHRCAATCAGASGGGHDNGVDSGSQQLLSILSSELLGRSNGSTVTNGGVIIVVQLADLAFLFKVAHDVDRQDAVRILIRVNGIVAAVGSLECLARQVVDTGDAILAVVGSRRTLDMIGVALGGLCRPKYRER